MKISSSFDSGSIVVLDASDPAHVRLALRPDSNGDIVPWFHFRASGVRGRDCVFAIENAGESRWAEGWHGYRVPASYDRTDWFRQPAEYDGRSLVIRHRPEFDSVYYSYAVPYTRARDRDFAARCQTSPRARVEVLGASLDGDDIDLLEIGAAGDGRLPIWVLARHHPSETQGAFAVEGLVERLLDEADAVARAVLARATFYVVPNINPDGSRRGNHRCNAAGTDLNRAWSDALMDKSPEVYLVRERMRQTGVAVCLDLHAAERDPYVWSVRTPGIPSWTERRAALSRAFDAHIRRVAPDYRPEKRNADHAPGKDPLSMAISWTAEALGAMSLIVEFPFLDDAEAPDARAGWSPARSRRFGAALIDALHPMLDELGRPAPP